MLPIRMERAQTQQKWKTYAGFIKVEHTVFSLPLIFAGMLLHTYGWPPAKLLALIVVAAFSGRVMAMGLNRILDMHIDARNPRTKQRELPRGAMRRREAWAIVVCAGAIYLASAAAIAPVCLQLSPIPIVLFVVYPYLKRVTILSHLGLGLAWSMGPLGGWVAASKSLAHIEEIWLLWFFSLLWVTGFDIVYATMDETFDRRTGLHSLPAWLGSQRALQIAALLHAVAFLILATLWYTQLYSPIALRWLIAVGILFIWQHAIAERHPGFAFFQLNGTMGFCVLGLVLAGMR